MKYLKYYEGRSNVNFDAIVEEYNKHLNPLGIKVSKRDGGTLNTSLASGFKFNLDFMCIPYSILHISTMIFTLHDSIKTAAPYIENESFNFIKSLDYNVEFKLKPYTEENIYNTYYNNVINKLTNFKNNIFITMNSGSNGNLNYMENNASVMLLNVHEEDNLEIDCRSVILEYLNSNKIYGSQVTIPQSSIDMVKYVINKFKGNQHKLIHAIQQNNPLVYEKIKDKNHDDAANMHDMGFGDDL